MWAEGYITIEIYLEYLEKNIDKFNDSAYYEPLLDTANLYRHHEYGERLFRIVDMLPAPSCINIECVVTFNNDTARNIFQQTPEIIGPQVDLDKELAAAEKRIELGLM